MNHLNSFYRLVFFTVFSVALMIFDHQTTRLAPVKQWITTLGTPVYSILQWPNKIHGFTQEYWPNSQLVANYTALNHEHTRLKAELQLHHAVKKENRELEALMQARITRDIKTAKLARVVEASVDDFDQRLLIDLGENDDLDVGLAVVDRFGLVGQLVTVGGPVSEVLLVSDASHAVPVENVRSGLRVILRGTGAPDSLSVPYVSFQDDIETGDMLITSGAGGVFPYGHPVAVVQEVTAEQGEAFLKIRAKPVAHLKSLHHLLVVANEVSENTDYSDFDTENSQASDNYDKLAPEPENAKEGLEQ